MKFRWVTREYIYIYIGSVLQFKFTAPHIIIRPLTSHHPPPPLSPHWSFQLQLTSSSVFRPCLIFCWHLDCSFVWSFSLMISFSVPFIISDNPLALALALYLQLPLFCYLSYHTTSFHVFLFAFSSLPLSFLSVSCCGVVTALVDLI